MIVNLQRLQTLEYFGIIRRLARMLGTKAYFVGGGVRDLLAGAESRDFDFALDGASEDLPRVFARECGGTFFWLDEKRRQSRVVVKRGAVVTFDFAPLRGAAIDEDLCLRDFTINAMAVELDEGPPHLIDPLGGARDLKEGVISVCSADAFSADPLRLLRALRLAVSLRYSLKNSTWNSLVEHAHLLAGVAAERVRDELFRMLQSDPVEIALRSLAATGLMGQIFPEHKTELQDEEAVDQGCISAHRVEEGINRLKEWFPVQNDKLKGYLENELEYGIPVVSVLKLIAFLRGGLRITRPTAIADRLRLGRKTARVVSQLADDLEEQVLILGDHPTMRARYRFYRDREVGPEMVILAMSEGLLSPRFAMEMINYYFGEYESARELLSGDEIMNHLGKKEGKELGRMICRLREAEARGEVNTREEALAFLGKKLLTKPTS